MPAFDLPPLPTPPVKHKDPRRRFISCEPVTAVVAGQTVKLKTFDRRSGCGWSGSLRTHVVIDGKAFGVTITVRARVPGSEKWPEVQPEEPA